MKFGVREIANVVFRAKSAVTIGQTKFKPGQPVLYIDSAKTSTLEGAATTVYAQGGRGNARLIAWEGEKTLTFTVEDALLSPIGLSILSGAGLIKKDGEEVHVHMSTTAFVDDNGHVDLTDVLGSNEICKTAPMFIIALEEDGSLTGKIYEGEVGTWEEPTMNPTTRKGLISVKEIIDEEGNKRDVKGETVMVDYYVIRKSAVSEIQIDAENFAGYYYVEADTLFRRQDNGVDMPANITLPNVKIQSNFTFSMASTGDPSTFTFTMDAMPGYTYFDKSKKVLCVIQVVEDVESADVIWNSVMKHSNTEKIDEASDDSVDYVVTEDEDENL